MDPAHGNTAAAVDPSPAATASDRARSAEEGQRGSDLLAYVRAEARRLEFDQALLVLEQAIGTDALRTGKLRVRPRTSPVFPASDIERVDVDKSGRVTMEVTFMGLYGPSPALPRYFTEPVDTGDANGLRAFLDLFGGRIYRLYHEAWRKYRSRARFRADAAGDAHAPADDERPFVALAGVPPETAVEGLPIPPLRLAALAGRLGTRVRNAPGLRDLLAHFLELPVTIQENQPRWVIAPSRGLLGAAGDAGVRLGASALLGGRIYDVSGKARVVFGPLDEEDFRSLLPGGARAALAFGLTRFYMPDGLDFDVELLLRERQARALVLGDGASRLGRNAWIGSTGEGVLSEIVSYN
jgi:type VI secretion system protein ImpH